MSDSHRQVLRDSMKHLRSQMKVQDVKGASERIAARVMELEPVRRARTIMGFYPIHNEVDLRPLLNILKGEGKTILLPRVTGNKDIEAVIYNSQQELRAGVYGILEPQGDASSPYTIDAVLVPGLVFDAQGYRLGYGAGYYDRFLPLLRKDAFRCGVCYEYQVVDNVHPHPEDIPVHWIVTDRSEVLINWDFF